MKQQINAEWLAEKKLVAVVEYATVLLMVISAIMAIMDAGGMATF